MKQQGAGSLLVICGATVTNAPDGRWVTKGPIADYLHEVSASFVSCTWIANRYEGSDYAGVIDERRVRVRVVESGWLARIASWLLMIRLAAQHDHVLYYLPNPYLPLLPLLRWRAKRLVVYLAGDYEYGIHHYAPRRWPGWARLFRWSFEYPMRRADAVIARGKRLARMAARFNARVHETIPMGHMNLAAGAPMFTLCQDRERRVLYIGKLVDSKGVRDLLKAMRLLAERFPHGDLRLDLVGDGAQRAEYQQLVQQQGMQQYVAFAGWISSSEQIDSFFKKAAVAVVPSVYPEGVPRVIDESIARGVPVIATPVGGIGEEFCDEEILLVAPQDPLALAEALERMLFDTAAREHHLHRAARRREFLGAHTGAAQQHLQILSGVA